MSPAERETIRRLLGNQMAKALLRGAVRQHIAGKEFSSWWLLLHAVEVVS